MRGMQRSCTKYALIIELLNPHPNPLPVLVEGIIKKAANLKFMSPFSQNQFQTIIASKFRNYKFSMWDSSGSVPFFHGESLAMGDVVLQDLTPLFRLFLVLETIVL